MSTGPLMGQRLVITRARPQAESMARVFEAAGAEIAFLPLLEVVPPEDPTPLRIAAEEIESYGWVVFTSANAVDSFLPSLSGPPPGNVRVAAVGPATARALRRFDAEPALVATKSHAEGLLSELRKHLCRGDRVLLPQADDARATLYDGLIDSGMQVVAVNAYRKRLPEEAPHKARELFDEHEIGWVTFTSPRVVRHFAGLFSTWQERRSEVRALSIGPVTSAELRRLGVEDVREARLPSPEEMLLAASL